LVQVLSGCEDVSWAFRWLTTSFRIKILRQARDTRMS
jgi:hypothetical protein